MADDYVSENLEKFDIEFTQFHGEAIANPTLYGFTAPDLTLIETDYSDWSAKFPAYLAAKAAYATAKADALASQTTGGDDMRHCIQSYSKKASATNAGRLALGGNAIGVSTPIPTSFSSVPVVTVENGERLQHTVQVRDSLKEHKGKPEAAQKIALYGIILAPGAVVPTDIKLYTRLGEITKYSMIVTYTSDKGSMVASYFAIYEGRNNLKSSPSDIVSATILP